MTSEPDVIVWPRHLYSVPYGGRLGYCAAGARRWFAGHGLSWPDFVARGIPGQRLLATGDPLAAAAVAHARALQEGGSNG